MIPMQARGFGPGGEESWSLRMAFVLRPGFENTRLSLCCQPSTSVAEYGGVASPVKAGLRPPPSAADGLDTKNSTARRG
jgi:hypothetical protein